MQVFVTVATFIMTMIGFGLIVVGFFGGLAKRKGYSFLVGLVAIFNAVGYSVKVGLGIALVLSIASALTQVIIASLYFAYATWKAR